MIAEATNPAQTISSASWNYNPREVNPVLILREVLRSITTPTETHDIYTRWPSMREATQKLCGLLTRLWPNPNDSSEALIEIVINEALLAARNSFIEGGDIQERNVYIQLIIAGVHCAFSTTLLANTRAGTKVFDPLNECLADWLEENRPTSLEWTSEPHPLYDQTNLEALLALRVFTLHDLHVAGIIKNNGKNQY
jgi:hypothetical protein